MSLTNMRVWLFQSDRLLTDEETGQINVRLQDFMKSWFTHGHKLSAQARVEHNLVITIQVDQEVLGASGCSIDKMTHMVQSIGHEFKIDFFNRQNVAVVKDEAIQLYNFQDIQAKLAAGELNEEDMMMDNLIENGADLESNWFKPISKSWLNRFITV